MRHTKPKDANLIVIEAVQQAPILWKMPTASLDEREVAWQQLATKMKVKAQFLQVRWFMLLKSYKAFLQQTPENPLKNPFNYAQQMSFLDPFINVLAADNLNTPQQQTQHKTAETLKDPEFVITEQDINAMQDNDTVRIDFLEMEASNNKTIENTIKPEAPVKHSEAMENSELKEQLVLDMAEEEVVTQPAVLPPAMAKQPAQVNMRTQSEQISRPKKLVCIPRELLVRINTQHPQHLRHQNQLQQQNKKLVGQPLHRIQHYAKKVTTVTKYVQPVNVTASTYSSNTSIQKRVYCAEGATNGTAMVEALPPEKRLRLQRTATEDAAETMLHLESGVTPRTIKNSALKIESVCPPNATSINANVSNSDNAASKNIVADHHDYQLEPQATAALSTGQDNNNKHLPDNQEHCSCTCNDHAQMLEQQRAGERDEDLKFSEWIMAMLRVMAPERKRQLKKDIMNALLT